MSYNDIVCLICGNMMIMGHCSVIYAKMVVFLPLTIEGLGYGMGYSLLMDLENIDLSTH